MFNKLRSMRPRPSDWSKIGIFTFSLALVNVREDDGSFDLACVFIIRTTRFSPFAFITVVSTVVGNLLPWHLY